MRTVGVDLAADPKRTALCTIDWVERSVTLAPRPVTDDVIVEAIAGCDKAGLDVPLGWPDAFVDALVAHRAGTGWPPVALEPPADRIGLRFRVTDVVAIAGGARPLSVSTDRIGVPAMRAARLQHLLVEAGVEVDRSGIDGRIAEAYPAGALRVWGMRSAGYKRTENAETHRRQLVSAVLAECRRFGSAADCLAGCDDDDLDAFICAVVGKAARLGMTTRPAPDQRAVAKREGWIHLPTAGLAAIIDAARRPP